MANGFALPALGHVLRHLLINAAPDCDLNFLGASGWQVSMLAPDQIKRGDADPPSLNLYLYQVAPNLDWRNRAVRTDDDSGERTSTRQLALDLRYLVTAYGSKAYQAETLLGHALLALHDHPLLTRDYIAESLALPVPSVAIDKHLAASGLAEEVEPIRLLIGKLSADDLARPWSGFNRGCGQAFRCSRVYCCSTAEPGRPRLCRSRRGASISSGELQFNLVPLSDLAPSIDFHGKRRSAFRHARRLRIIRVYAASIFYCNINESCAGRGITAYSQCQPVG